MKVFAVVLFSSAALAETKMLEIPDSLKNPAQLRWTAPVTPKRVVKRVEPPSTVCSVPLTPMPLREGAMIRAIPPRTSSNMPVLAPPDPPCEAPLR